MHWHYFFISVSAGEFEDFFEFIQTSRCPQLSAFIFAASTLPFAPIFLIYFLLSRFLISQTQFFHFFLVFLGFFNVHKQFEFDWILLKLSIFFDTKIDECNFWTFLFCIIFNEKSSNKERKKLIWWKEFNAWLIKINFYPTKCNWNSIFWFISRMRLKFFRQQTHPLYLYVFDLWFSKKNLSIKRESRKIRKYTESVCDVTTTSFFPFPYHLLLHNLSFLSHVNW